jgi:hypothetical protein
LRGTPLQKSRRASIVGPGSSYGALTLLRLEQVIAAGTEGSGGEEECNAVGAGGAGGEADAGAIELLGRPLQP